MADVKLSDKALVAAFTDKSLDSIPVDIDGLDIRRMLINDFISEIGGLPTGLLGNLGVLTAQPIAGLIEGEQHFLVAEGRRFTWNATMTPAGAALFWFTAEPDDKVVTNGYWVQDGSLIPIATVLTPGPTVALAWSQDKVWTLNNNQGGGITFSVTGLGMTDKHYECVITTNGNPLTLSGFDIVDGKYATGQTKMVLEFYMAGTDLVGKWTPKVSST